MDSSANGEKKKQSTNGSSNNEKKKQSTNGSSNNEKKKQSTNGSSNNEKKKPTTNNQSALQCLTGPNLEILVAVLLLTGKLRVDSVQLFRQATMIVGLTGEFITLSDLNNKNVDNMLKFLNDNGNMTVDDIISALKKKMNN
ncbi:MULTISPECIES: hypothetical protein [Brevibacillus]|uniref:Uncharacterized protein n=1 Tax=Brevibacillus brevis TaxID=1393 RepID=A0A2Z4MMQ5_BREBE|nr:MULTISPECIES: hypothetical protein [Brevibacillus]AWX57754.1 hypothetical protein AB432_023155 [Brevibacillus brevis]NRR24481.1 hypothetical protein [Brevibacillus sp. MS2.2]